MTETDAADLAVLRHYQAYLKITDEELLVKAIPGIAPFDPTFKKIQGALYRIFGVEDEDGLDYSSNAMRAGGANYLYGFTFPPQELIRFGCNHGGFAERLKEVATYLADNDVNFPGGTRYLSKTI